MQIEKLDCVNNLKVERIAFPKFGKRELMLNLLLNKSKLNKDGILNITPNITSVTTENIIDTIPQPEQHIELPPKVTTEHTVTFDEPRRYESKICQEDLLDINNILIDKKEPDDDDEKNELLWNFKLLQKASASNVCVDETSSIQKIKKMISSLKREIVLDDNINQSKQILIIFWWLLEKISTEYLSINITGFTTYEAKHINEYQKVLIEIGQRNYLNWSDNSPPEIKLLYLMLTHAAMFHIMRDSNDVDADEDVKSTSGLKGPSLLPF